MYIRFHIRSKEEQIQKQEAGIVRKTHQIASLEQSFSQRPIDSTSSSLYKVPFAGHRRAINSVCGWTLYFSITLVISSQTNEILENRCSTVLINYIFLLDIRLCLCKSRIANFTALNSNVTSPEIPQTCSTTSCLI